METGKFPYQPMCGGGKHLSRIFKDQSFFVLYHGNIRNQIEVMKPYVIYKLECHFEKLKEMVNINETKIMWEMTRSVTLHDSCDDKVYLPSWTSKQECSQIYCQKNRFEAKGNTSYNVILNQLAPN